MFSLFSKYVTGPLAGYIVVVLVTLMLVLSVAIGIKNARINTLTAEIAELNTQIHNLNFAIKRAVEANQSNLQTIADCQKVNAENKAQRDAVQLKASAAEKRIAELQKRLEISSGEPFENTETDCRQLNEPLSPAFVCWLRGTASADCTTD